ncbi:hypothetical protein Mapa_008660 [Marchantia paleacea]|nr:hypothetical protein Mapa_008660 [Marchantia paleacea]
MPLQSRTVVCYENRLLADWFFRKYQELDIAEIRQPNAEETLKRAFVGVCEYPSYIKNLHDAKKVKGIGPWLLKKMNEEFFQQESNCESPTKADAPVERGQKGRAKKRYLPGKNTAAYALLITLLRAHRAGQEFMRKQELIDASEKSGLSRKPIIPPKNSLWNGSRSGRDFYCGWSTMNNLVLKGLVIKASNPAKYMLTEEGKITAHECIEKSGLVREDGQEPCSESEEDIRGESDARECRDGSLSEGENRPDFTAGIQDNVRPYQNQSQGHRLKASYQSVCPQDSSVYPVPSRSLRQDEAAGLASSWPSEIANLTATGITSASMDTTARGVVDKSVSHSFRQSLLNAPQDRGLSSVSSTDSHNDLAMPPLKIGEKFSDVYDVICILDRREQFRRGSAGSHLQKFAERLETQFEIKVETRQVPVGDAIWIARHKQTSEEYVLDFVIERKAVDDLWMSIRDSRYKNQKLRLLKSGLKRLIYLVEGDVNMIDSTGSCKTAMFSTEIADGFHVLRTTDTNDTMKQYGHLTLAIKSRYQAEVGKRGNQCGASCKTYPNFVEHCKDLDRDRVTDIFCLQLMQINHVTEDIALSIQDRYPTIYSLVQAYTNLEGNVGAQEKLLQGLPIRGSLKTITHVLSKNVYKLIWAS